MDGVGTPPERKHAPAAAGRCTLCLGEGEQLNPLVPDEFYTGVQIHLHCLNGDAGRAWIRERREADPAFARYLDLTTVGRRVECASCGETSTVSPKSFGMAAGMWEGNCTACYRYRRLVSAYGSTDGREFVVRLELLRRRFVLGGNVPETLAELAVEDRVAALSERCECGGQYTLTAHPRCSRCAGVLLASPFHIAFRTAAGDGR